MPTVQVKAQLSFDELLNVVKQFNSYDLERFALSVRHVQAQRKAPSIPRRESELLLKINQKLPYDIQAAYDKLIAKRQAETLNSNEYQALLDLTEKVEQFEAKRIEAMTELAGLRQTSLTQLMDELGIKSPSYV
ncbi:MAG: STAS/SEC14 domain-containing protein [Pseudomonadota bacterium]